MNRILIKTVSILFLFFVQFNVAFAQNVAACNNAQNICTNPSFTFNSSPGSGLPGNLNISNPSTNPQAGNGANPTAPANSGCLLTSAPGPQWLMITVASTGNLGFVFGAAGSQYPQAGLYDWAMWAYNPTTCSNIFNNTQAPVSCNWNCSGTGGTGMGTPPAAVPGTTPSACNFQPTIPVVAGQQYLILLSNFSGVTTSVSIANNGSAGITCSPLLVPSAVACPNQPAVITATWTGPTNITYTLFPGGIVQTNPSFTVSAPATQGYTLFAQGADTANVAIYSSATFSLIISPTTTMSVTGPGNYCYGASANFTAATGGTSYTVTGPGYPPTTFPGNNISIPNVTTPANAGTFTVSTLIAAGCVAQGTMAVNIAPNTPIVVNSPTNVCLMAPLGLTAALPTATAYTWAGPNSFASAQQNPVINSVQLASAGIYSVTANLNFPTVNPQISCPRTSTTEVYVIETASITTVSGHTICEGSTLNLNAVAVGSSTYTWVGPGFNASAPDPSIPNIQPSSSGIYSVNAYFSYGNVTCIRTGTTNVAVVSTPSVNVAVTPNVCQYGNASFVANGQGAVSYFWTGPAGFTSNMQTNVISNIQPSQGGSYSVVATYAIGSQSCTVGNSGLITVVPVNSIAVAPATVSVCKPDNATFGATAIGAASYNWTGPNNFTANTPQTILYYPDLNATGVYTVTATFNAGGLTCYNTNTVGLVVNPVMSFSLEPFVRACKGAALNVTGPAGASSYTWSGGTGYSSSQKDLVIPDIQVAQSGIYRLKVSLGPCITEEEVEVEVLTPIQYTMTPNSRVICSGDNTLLEVGASGGSENYAYNWYPSVYLSAPTGSFISSQPLGTTVYNITAYDIFCPNYTVPYSFVITVNQPPAPDLQLEKTEGCQPLCLTYNSRTSAAITTYDFGGYRQMQGDNFSYCLNEPGIYNLKITSKGTNGCTGIYDYPLPLIVHPKPGADFSWSPEIPNTTDNIVTFNPVSNAGTVTAVNWMFTGTGMAGEDTSTLFTPQRTFENTGKFPVLFIAQTDKGCIDTVVKVLEIKDDFVVFIPNTFTPNGDGVNDLFMAKGLGFKPEGFSLDIYDRWGVQVFSTQDAAKGWDGTVKGREAPDGTYIYKLRITGANGEGRKEYPGHVILLR